MEIWGFCSTCRAWFPCPTWFDRSAPHPSCPTCDGEPSAIENRAQIRLDEVLDVDVDAATERDEPVEALTGGSPSDLWLG